MEHIVKHEYQLKRGKEEAILRQDPILKYGEPITMYREDGTTEFKVGDGVRPYSELPVPNKQVVMQADLSQNDETQPDYVKNRTHYVRKTYDDITWDGVVEEGQSYIIIDSDDTYYESLVKISDITPTIDEILGAKVEACEHTPEEDILVEFIVNEASLTDMIEDAGALIIIPEDTGIEQWVVYDSDKFLSYIKAQHFSGIINNLSNGIYVFNFVDTTQDFQAYVSEIEFAETVKKIDEKFLPNIITNYNDLIDAPELKNGNNPHSLLAGTGTTTSNDNQLSIGTFNKNVSDALFVVGNGTDEDKWVSVNGFAGAGIYKIIGYSYYNNGAGNDGYHPEIIKERFIGPEELEGMSFKTYAENVVGSYHKYTFHKFQENTSNAFAVYKNGTIAINNKLFDPQGFLEEVKNTFIQTTNNNITNSIGKLSLQQAADNNYTYVEIQKKNPFVNELGLDLTNETPIGATGDWATSFGGVSAAIGKRSLSCGTNTVAYGKYSLASGDNSIAYGNESFTSGLNNVAKGSQSAVFGSNNASIGQQSFTIGGGCKARGDQSFAGGQNSETIDGALRSFAFGDHCRANSNDQFVVGRYNAGLSADTLFAVGTGTASELNTMFKVTTYGAELNGQPVVTALDLSKSESSTNKKITDINNTLDKTTEEDSVVHIDNILNTKSVKIDSTVTDNYFFSKDYIKTQETLKAFNVNNSFYTASINIYTKNIYFNECSSEDATWPDTGYRYLLFTTGQAYDVNNSILTIGINEYSIEIPIDTLLPNNQYMLIIKQDDTGCTFLHMFDYTHKIDWKKGASLENLPYPDCYVVVHKSQINQSRGRITASWSKCGQYEVLKRQIEELREEIELLKSNM